PRPRPDGAARAGVGRGRDSWPMLRGLARGVQDRTARPRTDCPVPSWSRGTLPISLCDRLRDVTPYRFTLSARIDAVAMSAGGRNSLASPGPRRPELLGSVVLAGVGLLERAADGGEGVAGLVALEVGPLAEDQDGAAVGAEAADGAGVGHVEREE